MDAWWPEATPRPVSYAGQARAFAKPVQGWLLHVVVGDGSPWSTFEHAPNGNRRFSHLWVAKDGRAEQYAPLNREAWHAVAANTSWWGIETEGFPTEQLTLAQIATLARFHVWSLTSDTIANTPADHGIGTHAMGGAAWGGHTCPDPAPGLPGPRSHQRQQIITTAQAIRSQGADVPLTQADAILVADTIETRYQVHATDGSLITRDDALGRILATLTKPVPLTVDVQALAAAVVAALPTQPNGLTAAQVADELAHRLQA